MLKRTRIEFWGLGYRHLCILIAAAIAISSACTPNQRIVESSRTPEPVPEVSITPQVSAFDADLQSMRNADFKFILVFRRRDGGAMTSEDKAFINANTPPDVNRRRLSDDDKAVIIGSNFPFLPGTIANLTDRFVMEDHSKPEAGPIEVDRFPNTNTNANAAARPKR
jgi:hypothetical protein